MTRHFRSFALIQLVLLMAGLQIACGQKKSDSDAEQRLAAMEQRIAQLENEIKALRAQLAEQIDAAEPVGTAGARVDPAEPVGTAGARMNPAEPVGNEGARRDPAEPVGTAGARRDPAEPVGQTGFVEGIAITPNAEMKGVMGRLVVSFPDGAKVNDTLIQVIKPADGKVATSDYGAMKADLLPGKYDVVISGARVAGVEIKSKSDTTIRAGVLRTSANSSTLIAVKNAAGDKQVTSTYGTKEIGLPAGKFTVTVAGQSMPVQIKPGEATDF